MLYLPKMHKEDLRITIYDIRKRNSNDELQILRSTQSINVKNARIARCRILHHGQVIILTNINTEYKCCGFCIFTIFTR